MSPDVILLWALYVASVVLMVRAVMRERVARHLCRVADLEPQTNTALLPSWYRYRAVLIVIQGVLLYQLWQSVSFLAALAGWLAPIVLLVLMPRPPLRAYRALFQERAAQLADAGDPVGARLVGFFATQE